jgi:sulfite exporter TauE/SafE/copper chaperone CopZ
MEEHKDIHKEAHKADHREGQAGPRKEEHRKHLVTRKFIAEGTTCDSCAEIIKRQALKVDGVASVKFDLESESGEVTFDPAKTDLDAILFKIEEKNYKCYLVKSTDKPAGSMAQTMGWVFAALGVVIIGYFVLGFLDTVSMPQFSQNMGYGLLLLVGLLTGFHCIAMCGGFVVGYTTKNAQEGKKPGLSHLMYGSGKVISYTVIGAVFGLLGSIIAFTPRLRGFAGILAGVFLVLFGLRMLNVIPGLRRFGIRAPGFLSKLTGQGRSPLVIGLLNGLMIACGPLQAVYIMAAGTGSMIEGAKLLFIFALGTLPVMLGFGYVTSFISSKMTRTILKASGVVVILLGVFMLNNGLMLTGSGYDARSLVTSVSAAGPSPQASQPLPAVSSQGFQEIHMTVDASGFTPDTFVLQKGVPVKWIIDGKQLTSCNRAIQVPAYNLKFDVKQGLQTIEFTPTETGTIRWSCWMGMIPGSFIVKDTVTAQDQQQVQSQPKAAAGADTGGSCNMGSGGSCGCGMM